MYQAAKIGPKSPGNQTPTPQAAEFNAELAADYKLSPVAQVTLDRNGCICRANIAASILLKGELAQLVDIPLIAFVDKADCRLFLDHVAEATSAGKKVCTRVALAASTRATGPVELQSMAITDAQGGRSSCRTAIITLSSERWPAGKGFQGKQNGYEEWFELFPDAAILEIGGKIIAANPGAVALLGATSFNEIQGKETLELIHPDSHASFRERVSRLPERKIEEHGADERLLRLNGEEIGVNIVLKSINFDGVEGLLIVARDVSKLHEMEESVARAKDFSSQILANNSIATAVISLETQRFLEANRIFCKLTGRRAEQIIGRPFSTIGLMGLGNGQRDFLGEFVSGGDSKDREAKLNRPDGAILDVLVSAKTILSGEDRRVLLMIQDLTDLRRLRKDVVSISEEEQRRFSRDLHDSHCQDLTAIAFFAETLAAGLSPRDHELAGQVRMLVEMVQKSADNVHALAAGLDAQQIQDVGLVAALDELVSRTGRRFSMACKIDVDKKFSDNNPVHAIHLYRIAQEAMSNAAKHSHARLITLSLRRKGGIGILQIRDDGIGFPDAQKMSGLGLRSMRYRASVMGGSLKIDSTPGAGTVVTCSFPKTVE